jgi:recombination protein RecR
MPSYPQAIENLIKTFSMLPGIGRKTAERFVFYLLKRPKGEIHRFSEHLKELHDNLHLCPDCFNFSGQQGQCGICRNSSRDPQVICVVEEIHDLIMIENTNEHNGVYHVLGGKIDPIEGIMAANLTVKKLVERVQSNNVQEIILALNPDIQGEATILYLKKLFATVPVKITLLARGLPMGSDIEYADEITLSNALKGRREIR